MYPRYFSLRGSFALFRSFFIPGAELEEKLAERLRGDLGFRFIFFTANARSAIASLLRSNEGCRSFPVLLQAYTCQVVADAVLNGGAKPILVDIDADSLSFPAVDINKKISAAIVTYLYGMDASVPQGIRSDENILLIEDAAQAFGQRDFLAKQRRNSAVVFSFGLGKVLSCIEGGVIATNDESIAAKLCGMQGGRGSFLGSIQSLIRYFFLAALHRPLTYGILRWLKRLFRAAEGTGKFSSLKPDRVQLAIFSKQLEKLDWEKRERRRICEFYARELSDLHPLQIPQWPRDGYLSIFALRTKFRKELLGAFERSGIECIPAYPYALHHLPRFFPYLGGADFPNAEQASEKVLCLPFYGALKPGQLRKICRIVREVHSRRV